EDLAVVFLQTGTADGLKAARGVADFAQQLALESLREDRPDDAVTALELGRGLVVYSATATTGIPEMLRAADRVDLAKAWEKASSEYAAAVPAPGGEGAATPADAVAAALPRPFDPASDLRIRVVAALAGPDTAAGRALFSACDPQDVAAALRILGRTALAYVIPGAGDQNG